MARIEETPERPAENRLTHRITLLTTGECWKRLHEEAARVGLRPHEWCRAIIADELRRLDGQPMRTSPLTSEQIDEIMQTGTWQRRRMSPEARAELHAERDAKRVASRFGSTKPWDASDEARATHAATRLPSEILSHPTGPSINHSTSLPTGTPTPYNL